MDNKEMIKLLKMNNLLLMQLELRSVGDNDSSMETIALLEENAIAIDELEGLPLPKVGEFEIVKIRTSIYFHSPPYVGYSKQRIMNGLVRTFNDSLLKFISFETKNGIMEASINLAIKQHENKNKQ